MLSLLALSCTRERDEVDRSDDSEERSTRLTVSEARRYFESEFSQGTRSSTENGSDRLVLGNYWADWSGAEISVGDILYSIDVPADGEYTYYSLQADSLGKIGLVPMYHKLVVVKDGDTESLNCYIRFYIPTGKHARAHSEAYYAALLNSDVKGDFTGTSVYTTLDGFPVCAARYSQGRLRRSAFLGDTLNSLEENCDRLADLLEGMMAARVRKGIGFTRAAKADSIPINGDKIDDVIIFSDPIKQKDNNKELKDWGSGGGLTPPNDPTSDDRSPGSGSGPAGDNNDDKDDDGKYDKNKNILTNDPNIERLLDSIAIDCMGKALVGSLKDIVVITKGSISYEGVMIPIPIYSGDKWVSTTYSVILKGYSDVAMIEELIHVHQYSGKEPKTLNSYKMNNEIEAKLGWYMYRDKRNDLKDDVTKALGGKQGVAIFGELSKNLQLSDTESLDFYNMYMGAVSILRRSYPEKDFPLSQDRMNFQKLIELMKDC